MRITGEKIDIAYEKTKEFYDQRASKYTEDHPYLSVMCQDNHPEIAEERNRTEIAKILPLLHLNESSRVLDLGCGVGRWADAIPKNIFCYFGCDFSEDLITIARQRNCKSNFDFECIPVTEIEEFYLKNNILPFTHVILSGVMMYLNDKDVEKLLEGLDKLTQEKATVYIREPMGIIERLTLKEFYSEELQHEYNTIYRTRDEYRSMIAAFAPAFQIYKYGPMFDNAMLNNRKETAQFYFILNKKVKV